MKILVIVESSTKEKTIKKYLDKAFEGQNNTYTVKASGGHICDIVKKDMGIDLKTFQPIYQTMKDKQKTISTLIQLSKSNDITLLASDNDREGEAIAWHLKNILKPKKYKRIIFNEITENALHYAVTHPKDIDMKMVDSQQSRRILDRLVGFNLTKVLWKNFSSNTILSAGRVQSVVLLIVASKEKDVEKFVSEKYWNVLNSFNNGIIDAKLYHNESICKFKDEKDVVKLLKTLQKNNEYIIASNKIKDVLEHSEKPFTTSTLQQKASSHGFSIKETMKVAQELYELGHITYMRTDSTNISNDFKGKISDFIEKTYGKDHEFNGIKRNMKQQKNAQEAHEAIRPTKLVRITKLNNKQIDLYDLIFNRAVASMMIPAKYKEMVLEIRNSSLTNNQMFFVGKMKHIVELGYKRVYCDTDKCKGVKDVDKLFQKFKVNEKIKSIKLIGNCIWTSPPQRYNEASIIKYMEESGIGRPSTYVSILNKLYERRFVLKTDKEGPIKIYDDFIVEKGILKQYTDKKELYQERGKLIPTESGKLVNEFLISKFSDIVNIEFTSEMEKSLDDISEGSKTYTEFIKPFHTYITNKCENSSAERGMKKNLESDKYEMKVNGKPIIIRTARFGPVIEIVSSDKSKSQYIPLKPYLKSIKKSDIKEITPDDVKFLMKFPVKYKDYTIHYKGYGFYVENTEKKTLSVYPKFFEDLKNEDYDFVEKMFIKH